MVGQMNPRKRLLLVSFLLFLCLVPVLLTASPASARWEYRLLLVTLDQKHGEGICYMKNKGLADLNVTIWLYGVVNAEPDQKLPYTITLAPGEERRVLTIRQITRNAHWHYEIMYNWRQGSPTAKHDDSIEYSLPFPSTESYPVLQGYNGQVTHFGEYAYSIDWYMPEGSAVCAARKGLVVDVEDSFEGCDLTDYYRTRNNYIKILHDDGTIAEYCHFKKGGAVVRMGQKVEAGDIIGYSGDVGYSNCCHLHFNVCIPIDGKTIRTIPVRFDKPLE